MSSRCPTCMTNVILDGWCIPCGLLLGLDATNVVPLLQIHHAIAGRIRDVLDAYDLPEFVEVETYANGIASAPLPGMDMTVRYAEVTKAERTVERRTEIPLDAILYDPVTLRRRIKEQSEASKRILEQRTKANALYDLYRQRSNLQAELERRRGEVPSLSSAPFDPPSADLWTEFSTLNTHILALEAELYAPTPPVSGGSL